MQLGPATNNLATIAAYQALTEVQQAATREIRDAADVQALLRSYYEPTLASTPMYDEAEFPVVVGSQAELAIRGQLTALVDKAVSVLTERCRDYTAHDAERLQQGFGNKIRDAQLHPEERHYFYSPAFKRRFEQRVALAHRATPGENNAEITELKNLCYMLNKPSSFFMAVVGRSVVEDFANNFNQALR